MKKIILLICLLMPLASFGQKKQSYKDKWHQEREQRKIELMNRTSGDYLQSASTSLVLGSSLSIIGGTLAGLSTVVADDYDSQKAMAYIGGGISIIGLVLTIKGYVDIGKAGKKLKYEIGSGHIGLAFNW